MSKKQERAVLKVCKARLPNHNQSAVKVRKATQSNHNETALRAKP